MSEPRGAATSTTSPFFLPMIALPTGDSFESFCSAGFASAEPTIRYSNGLVRAHVAQLHVRADRDDVLGDVLLLDHARGQEPLLEQGDPVLDQRLLVLRVVVLGVLGDVAELAGDADALGDLPPLVGGEVVDLLLQLLVALFGEDDFLGHLGLLLKRNGAAQGRRRGPEWYTPAAILRKRARGYAFPHVGAGFALVLVDSATSRCRPASCSRRWRA